MKKLIAGVFLLMSSGVFAGIDDPLYFEGDENFSPAPTKIRQIIRTTEEQGLEPPMAGIGPVFHDDKYEFDEKGRVVLQIPSFVYWDAKDISKYGVGRRYKNFYNEQGQIRERWESCYESFSTITKKLYDHSGINTTVTERYCGLDGDTEELCYTEWIYHWKDGRLLSKNVFYGPLGESRSEYQYYECFGMPWDGKLKKVVTTRSDYDKFFRPINPKVSEKLLNYDVEGWLKEEIFIGASGDIDFINTYDERGDLVEIKAYYSSGMLASREELKHSYEKINGVELRTKTVTTMYRVEWRDKGDGSFLETETAHQRETVTYKYEFYK